VFGAVRVDGEGAIRIAFARVDRRPRGGVYDDVGSHRFDGGLHGFRVCHIK